MSPPLKPGKDPRNGRRVTNSWSPSDLGAGLALWLRADLGLTMGTGISQWADQSGNGRNYSQAIGSQQPTPNTAINGQATLEFNAATQRYLGRAGAFSFTSAHVFIVLKLTTDAEYNSLWRFGNDTQSWYPFGFDIYDDFGSTARKSAGNPATSLATAHCYEVISTPSEWTNKINGTQLFTTAVNTVGWDPAGTVIGGAGSAYATITGFLTGDMAEVIFCDSKLTSTRANVIAYLNSRYALGMT